MKTILITGAAQGLGKALALEFLKNGYHVIATDICPDMPQEYVKNDNICWFKMDVTSDEDVNRVSSDLSEKGITLDVIINNAGVDDYFPFSEADTDRFRQVFEVNVFGAYQVNRAFLNLLKQPGGLIIHISSESVNLVVPFMPYPLSKKALEGYVRSLRQELRFLGIDVTMIRPGPIKTVLLENVEKISFPVKNETLNTVFRKFSEMAPKNIGKVISATEAAKFIYQVAEQKKIKVMYRINNDLKLRIAAIFPYSIQEKIIYRQLK